MIDSFLLTVAGNYVIFITLLFSIILVSYIHVEIRRSSFPFSLPDGILYESSIVHLSVHLFFRDECVPSISGLLCVCVCVCV